MDRLGEGEAGTLGEVDRLGEGEGEAGRCLEGGGAGSAVPSSSTLLVLCWK